jgi:hypothetical protein
MPCHHDLFPFKARLPQQRLQPRLELVVEVVQKDGASGGDLADIGRGRLVELAVPARPDDRCDPDMVPADIL